MSEWWTYTLSDLLLFSPRTYYRLFELYNLAIWPAQIVALAGGIAIVVLWRQRGRAHGAIIATLLAAGWLWVAWAYLVEHYDTINWAASYLAIPFALQALLLLWVGAVRGRLRLRWCPETAGCIGLGMFLFALVAQPLIAPLAGRPWLQGEAFGVAPDPTVLATLGILVAAERAHGTLVPIPLLWCALSGATLWTMRSPEAFLLPAAAAVTLILMVVRMREAARAAT